MLKASQMFSNNMVLQREKTIRVWGTGDEGRVVTCQLGGNSARATVKDGKWLVKLPPMSAARGLTLIISDNDEVLEFYDVAVGEVWFLGGQSNMELEIQNAKDGHEHLAGLTAETPVRYYYTPKVATAEEAEEMGKNSGWGRADPEGSRAWSAVGLHFGLKLAKDLGCIVGLIGCNWGGTSASSWVDRETLERDRSFSIYMEEYDEKIKGKSLEDQKAEYDQYVKDNDEWNRKAQEMVQADPSVTWDDQVKALGPNLWPGPMNEYNPFRPTNMYHNMVMRVCPYSIRGFLYYQGESDDHRPDSYYRLFTALIAKWRSDWGEDDLPFIMTQLPMFKYADAPDYKHWAKIRSAQMKAFRTVKNTGIAVILDCGEFNEIHPKDKVPVGQRLCLQAEQLVYGMEADAFGPIYRDSVVQGSGIVVRFDHAENGFDIRGDKALGFELAGEDGEFIPAEASVQGDKIVVSSPDLGEPRYVRYAWTDYAEVNVFGKNGIPLAPFSTFDEELG